MKKIRYIILLATLVTALLSPAQTRNLEPAIEQSLASLKPDYLNIGEIKLKRFTQKGNRLTVEMNDEFSYLPFRDELVRQAYDTVRAVLPPKLKHKKLTIYAGGYEISRLVPFADRHKRFAVACHRPVVEPVGRLYTPTHGLLNRHIAL